MISTVLTTGASNFCPDKSNVMLSQCLFVESLTGHAEPANRPPWTTSELLSK